MILLSQFSALFIPSLENDFSEICITSLAKVIQDNNMEKDIEVTCKKAEGEKCSVCWKISKSSCEKHGHLTN